MCVCVCVCVYVCVWVCVCVVYIHIYTHIYIQCIYICKYSCISALLPPLDCVLNQVGWHQSKLGVSTVGLEQLDFFCREFRILEPEIIFFGKNPIRCGLQKVGVVCWLVGLMPSEGTGTRPDYLVNRDDKKMRGHSGGKIARTSRNNCRVNSRSCGCIGTVDSGSKFAHSWNQIQTLK